jgi:hypothetical protein
MLAVADKLFEEMMEKRKGGKKVQGQGIAIGLCFRWPCVLEKKRQLYYI